MAEIHLHRRKNPKSTSGTIESNRLARNDLGGKEPLTMAEIESLVKK